MEDQNENGIVQSGRELQARSVVRAVFDPDRLQVELERNLPAALRGLAAAIETGQMSGKLSGFTPYGFAVDRHDERVHLIVKLHLAAEIRKQLSVDAVHEVWK
jgi:hypothetical protein